MWSRFCWVGGFLGLYNMYLEWKFFDVVRVEVMGIYLDFFIVYGLFEFWGI